MTGYLKGWEEGELGGEKKIRRVEKEGKVHVSDVVQIGENESFSDVKTHCDDIFGVRTGHFSVTQNKMREEKEKLSRGGGRNLAASTVISFHKNFSSPVIWITRGALNASCNHFAIIKGIK